MKILFIWHAAVEPEYRKLFKEIANMGHDLTVIIPRSWIEGGRVQTVDEKEMDGYKILSLPIMFQNRIKAFFYLEIKKLIQTFYKFKPDIVHIFEEPYSLSCFQLVVLSRMLCPGAKIIVESFENIMIPSKIPISFMERFVLGRTDILITIPEEGKSVWKMKGFSKPITQIPVGLDENLFKKTDGSIKDYNFLNNRDEVRVAYVGRLIPEKGVDLLIEAFSTLVKSHIDCELLIVGNGEKEYFKSLVYEHGISDKVSFINAVENRLLPTLYSKIDILTLPSRTTATWKEQFGRVLIEAMACEVAVVGSDSGEIPNVIGDAGLIFKEGDKEALIEVLTKLIESEDLRKSFGRAGRIRVLENFTWNSIGERLVKVYSGALG